nr:MAG TPA: hypothetical protein [Caudoviricetes sp.]
MHNNRINKRQAISNKNVHNHDYSVPDIISCDIG